MIKRIVNYESNSAGRFPQGGIAHFAMYAERQDVAKGHEFTRAEEVIPVFSFRGFSH